MKKFLFRVTAKIKPRELIIMIDRTAVDFFSLPAARGLFDFMGWSLSSSRSLRSFNIYSALERIQKTTKAKTVFISRERLKIF